MRGEKNNMVSDFIAWMKSVGCDLRKVKLSRNGTVSARYGVIATEHIKNKEVIFRCPANGLLREDTCSISSAWRNAEPLQEDDRIMKLVVCLMNEYADPQSAWRPFLRLVPSLDDIDAAQVWSKSEINTYLKGTGCDSTARKMSSRIRGLYFKRVVPFLKENGLDKERYSYALFKHMYAFQAAYAVVSDRRPAIVPFAGFFNHDKARNQVRNFADRESFWIEATDVVRPGEEIFMTYLNTANCHLLTSYGFVEEYRPTAVDQAVAVPMSTFFRVAGRAGLGCLSEKFSWLQNAEFFPAEGSFQVSAKGVATDATAGEFGAIGNVKNRFPLFMKVLANSGMKCNTWNRLSIVQFLSELALSSEDYRLMESRILSIANIATALSDVERRLLRHAIEQHVSDYPDHVTRGEDDHVKSRRKELARKLVFGQKQLLNDFLSNLEL